jgi:hypothetical protein
MVVSHQTFQDRTTDHSRMPQPSRISSHSCVVLCFVTSSMRSSKVSLCCTLRALVMNRSSVIHSGFPSRLQSTPYRRSLPPPRRISPSDVLKALYGTIDARSSVSLGPIFSSSQNIRCDVPHLPVSFWPLMRHELAIFARVATWQSLNATSICWPLPVFMRARRAAMTEFDV